MTTSSRLLAPETEPPKWLAPEVGDGNRWEPVSEESIELERKEARAAGYAEGMQSAIADSKAALAPKIAVLDKLISQLQDPLLQLEADVMKNLVDLSMRIARTLVQRELVLDPELVMTAVSAAIAETPENSAGLTITVNPEDLQRVSQSLDTEDGRIAKVLRADSTIAIGDAVVTSGSSTVDGQLDARLASLLEDLQTASGGALD